MFSFWRLLFAYIYYYEKKKNKIKNKNSIKTEWKFYKQKAKSPIQLNYLSWTTIKN